VWHGREQSMLLRLPPLSLLLLKPRDGLTLLSAHDTESPADRAPTEPDAIVASPPESAAESDPDTPSASPAESDED